MNYNTPATSVNIIEPIGNGENSGNGEILKKQK